MRHESAGGGWLPACQAACWAAACSLLFLAQNVFEVCVSLNFASPTTFSKPLITFLVLAYLLLFYSVSSDPALYCKPTGESKIFKNKVLSTNRCHHAKLDQNTDVSRRLDWQVTSLRTTAMVYTETKKCIPLRICVFIKNGHVSGACSSPIKPYGGKKEWSSVNVGR